MSEFFVIRTAGGQYVGAQGLTSDIEQAVFFPSRWIALKKCDELGSVMDGGAILPYSPAAPQKGPATAAEAQGSMEGGPESAEAPSAPRKAGNGHL